MFTFLTLFGFWLTLSQKFDVLHMTEGFILCATVSFITLKYIFPKQYRPPFSFGKVLSFFSYCMWLLWQVVDSNIKLIPVILKPIMPINPRVIQFDEPLPHVFAQLTLANSITLTPGTITLDIDKDTFIIHGLTNDAIKSLLPKGAQGDMQRRVKALFPSIQTVTEKIA